MMSHAWSLHHCIHGMSSNHLAAKEGGIDIAPGEAVTGVLMLGHTAGIGLLLMVRPVGASSGNETLLVSAAELNEDEWRGL